MKQFIKVSIYSLLILILIVLVARITGNGYLIKGVWATYLHGHNSASIDDHRFFDTHAIKAGNPAEEWPIHPGYNKKPIPGRLEDLLVNSKTVAFLIIKNDSIINENYWNGYNENSLSNSFSVSKSITTLLCQIAIQRGIFNSWNQKVGSILPDLTGPHASELELWHLSTMSSGLDWSEKYHDPFNITARSYYGDDIRNTIMKLKIINKPGQTYNYQSGATQLLGLCLISATGKTLAELASEWLWKPINAKNDALWNTDNKGVEIAFCCFNSNARDFARFGKLMLHYGNWEGRQIIDSTFVVKATTPQLAPFYGYSFWIDFSHGTKIFYQRGIMGQYIIALPEYHVIIVRLGEHRLMTDTDEQPTGFHLMIDEVIKMMNKP